MIPSRRTLTWSGLRTYRQAYLSNEDATAVPRGFGMEGITAALKADSGAERFVQNYYRTFSNPAGESTVDSSLPSSPIGNPSKPNP